MRARANILSMEFKASPAEAPDYNTNGEGFKAANILKAIIVKKGTVEGNDTVDLQFEDEAGQKYVAMLTGRLIKSLAAAINTHELH